MGNVSRLPTAATSYYTVRKSGKWWTVELVTPAPGRALRTKLRSFSTLEAANADVMETGKRMLRPCKFGAQRHG